MMSLFESIRKRMQKAEEGVSITAEATFSDIPIIEEARPSREFKWLKYFDKTGDPILDNLKTRPYKKRRRYNKEKHERVLVEPTGWDRLKDW